MPFNCRSTALQLPHLRVKLSELSSQGWSQLPGDQLLPPVVRFSNDSSLVNFFSLLPKSHDTGMKELITLDVALYMVYGNPQH